jgi:Ca2+-binding RTX toxin-like protein
MPVRTRVETSASRPEQRRLRPWAVAGMLAAAAALLAVAAPASAQAGATCAVESNPGGDRLTVTTDVDVALSVAGSMLLIDGAPCGSLTATTNLRPIGPVAIAVDVSARWPHPAADDVGTPQSVQLDVFASGTGGTLRFAGSGGADSVAMFSGPDGSGEIRFLDRPTEEFDLRLIFVARESGDPGGSQNLVFDLGAGADFFAFSSSTAWEGSMTVDGGPGRDTLLGGIGRQTLRGGGGNDLIDGGPGNDRIDGGPGNDLLVGGPGNDRITGGPGRDTAGGGPGRDRFFMRDGSRDRVDGGPGRDTCVCDPEDVRRRM